MLRDVALDELFLGVIAKELIETKLQDVIKRASFTCNWRVIAHLS